MVVVVVDGGVVQFQKEVWLSGLSNGWLGE